MQLDPANRSGLNFFRSALGAALVRGLPSSRLKNATRLSLVIAAIFAVSVTGCRSCLDLCHWHQRPALVHSVHYHAPVNANVQVSAPVSMPAMLDDGQCENLNGMMGGSGISDQVPMLQSGDWPGDSAVDVAPVPREWGEDAETPMLQGSSQGMADVPHAIESTEPASPPIEANQAWPVIEL